jgi:hypothetical protein
MISPVHVELRVLLYLKISKMMWYCCTCEAGTRVPPSSTVCTHDRSIMGCNCCSSNSSFLSLIMHHTSRGVPIGFRFGLMKGCRRARDNLMILFIAAVVCSAISIYVRQVKVVTRVIKSVLDAPAPYSRHPGPDQSSTRAHIFIVPRALARNAIWSTVRRGP